MILFCVINLIILISFQKSIEKIKEWIKGTEELSQCVHAGSIKIEGTQISTSKCELLVLGEIETMGINPFVRHGFRTLANLTDNASVKDREFKADVGTIEFC